MRSSNGLSVRQEKILNYIRDFLKKNNYPPAIRDIQNDLGISSTSVVAYNLRILEEKGKISRDGKISRGISIPGMTLDQTVVTSHGFTVPMLGMITAGSPLPNPEAINVEDAEQIEVPAELGSAEKLRDVYALKVRGYSMVDALIGDGDIVLLRYQETADNGQTVVARLVDENAVTLKKFYHEGERIRLQPANVTMEPIFTTPDNLHIQGRVVGVIRSVE
ncbi:transcriptional repressor LexA [Candidatus Chloroploca sp. M-50]|uniref:LexA repressor n=1 Tax=Candidatus Chloroploca mongolica TaxID=2528176 RepID=A0ABS4D5X1_9CHLR|nr:transcriptional repressor LexA [Candidatus Chloroploca mongolica]MBP1464836.1 transcriptional repressor LexA [Candidatus Chloroploca mongolica]